MRTAMRTLILAFAVLAWLSPRASAGDTHYVWAGSPSNGPGTSWATAFHDIQSAIDAAGIGDTVLVTNGVYSTGGGMTPGGTLTSRVAAVKAIMVRSVNGPANTLIVGQGPLGDGAARCAYLANGASLSGFTVTNGFTRVVPTGNVDGNGGGVYAGAGCVISNCALTCNTAFCQGGGVYGGTVKNCVMTRNSAFFGGAACDSAMSRCAITNNSALAGGGACGGFADNSLIVGNSAVNYGGGTFWGAVNNCTIGYNSSSNGGGTYCSAVTNSIVFYNTAVNGANFAGGTYAYSCTTPEPGGIGNIAPSSPLFAGGRDCHLRGGSPGIDAGNNAYMPAGSDLEGTSRPLIGNPDGAATVDMGCYEYVNPHPGPASIWYVWTNSPANGPGTSWATAFHDIQSGIDAAIVGDTVLVTNGVYAIGSRTTPGWSLACRIVATNAIKVRSVNGPASTFIVGQGPLGNSAVRCAYLAYGTRLSGFTLSNGYTRVTGSSNLEIDGGGVNAGDGVVLSNCVIASCFAGQYGKGGGMYGGALVDSIVTGSTACDGGGACGVAANNSTISGNLATFIGGGVYQGTLNNCTISGNVCDQGCGGAYDSTLNDCLITGNRAPSGGGGGANLGTLNRCVVSSNSASQGGGVESVTANNCLIFGNSCVWSGGGADGGTLNNCTICSNSTPFRAGGANVATLNNCIVYFNSAPANPNWYAPTASYSCTTPNPGGPGNITSAPVFVGGDSYHLQAGSPCIDAGSDALMPAGNDLDGVSRPRDGNGDGVSIVDMGCYEYVNGLVDSDGDGMPDVWETAYGLNPHNPNDASLDVDRDGMSNLAEYKAGTVPTDENSVLEIAALEACSTGLMLRWPSVAERYYTIGSGPDLRLPLTNPAASHLQATPPTNSATVNPGAAATMFYRVIVE